MALGGDGSAGAAEAAQVVADGTVARVRRHGNCGSHIDRSKLKPWIRTTGSPAPASSPASTPSGTGMGTARLRVAGVAAPVTR